MDYRVDVCERPALAMIGEYRRSLKMPEAEEIFDLLLYRPLGFLFAKSVSQTAVTPNQVTALSLFAGLIAAWSFSLGEGYALVSGAVWYAIANILDCADGQLARMQQSGTPLGRIIDGVADYISSVMIFLGIGIGMMKSGDESWILVVAAGISSALHAMLFDHYQSQFIAMCRGERHSLETEIEQYTRRGTDESKGHRLRFAVIRIYLQYLGFQQRLRSRDEREGKLFRLNPVTAKNLVRLWSFLGPTTNRTALIVCAILGRIDLYLWFVVLAANMWLLMCMALQKREYMKTPSFVALEKREG